MLKMQTSINRIEDVNVLCRMTDMCVWSTARRSSEVV